MVLACLRGFEFGEAMAAHWLLARRDDHMTKAWRFRTLVFNNDIYLDSWHSPLGHCSLVDGFCRLPEVHQSSRLPFCTTTRTLIDNSYLIHGHRMLYISVLVSAQHS